MTALPPTPIHRSSQVPFDFHEFAELLTQQIAGGRWPTARGCRPRPTCAALPERS
jgi:hypothetical protein